MRKYKLKITVEDIDGYKKSVDKFYHCADSKAALYNLLHRETTFSYMQIVDLVSRKKVRAESGQFLVSYLLERVYE